MVFCNDRHTTEKATFRGVTILILIDGFLQCDRQGLIDEIKNVTILILIDGFLQSKMMSIDTIFVKVTILILIDGFLQ